MNCPQCQAVMIDAQATSFGETYKYCRTCKKELKEMSKFKPLTSNVTVNGAIDDPIDDPHVTYYTPKSLSVPPLRVVPMPPISLMSSKHHRFSGAKDTCSDCGMRLSTVQRDGLWDCSPLISAPVSP